MIGALRYLEHLNLSNNKLVSGMISPVPNSWRINTKIFFFFVISVWKNFHCLLAQWSIFGYLFPWWRKNIVASRLFYPVWLETFSWLNREGVQILSSFLQESLPIEICLTHLRTLDVSHNALESLPDDINHLNFLKVRTDRHSTKDFFPGSKILHYNCVIRLLVFRRWQLHTMSLYQNPCLDLTTQLPWISLITNSLRFINSLVSILT